MDLTSLLEKYKGDRFFDEVFVKKIYQPVWELGELNTVVDLGACTGEFSYWIYDRAKIIYAIEPVEKYFDEMKQTVDEYKLNKIQVYNLALGSFDGRGYMNETKTKGGATLMQDSQVTKNQIEIQTLATFMRKNQIDSIDVLKVDIENGELAVFSAPDFAQVADKINFIIGEHGGGLEQILSSFGFKYRQYPKGFIFER